MKKVLGFMAMMALLLSPVAFAGDADDVDDAWNCTCTAACDGTEISITVSVCADDDAIGEAVDDGAASCGKQLDGKCEEHAACTCECKLTGADC